MSQYDPGTIDPNTKDGTSLANDLNNWRDALHSMHRGITAPSYATAGMLWLDDSATPSWSLKIYDGLDWITLRTIDINNNDALLSISEGGTGANTIEDARSNLGITNVGKNLIINGDFNSWQEGTSFSSAVHGTYFADLFQYVKSGSMVHDINISTDTPTVSESGHKSNHSIEIDCTGAVSSLNPSDHCFIWQHIEGYNFKDIAEQSFTLFFWHKHSKAGTYSVAFRNAGADSNYVSEYTQSVANTWEKSSITISASPGTGTWNYTNGIGLSVFFLICCGTTYQTTTNSWLSNGLFASTNQVNACDTVGNKFRIAQVKLEAGSTATPFESGTIQEELASIYRYYWRIQPHYPQRIFSGSNYSASQGESWVKFPVLMRVGPTFFHSGVSDWIWYSTTTFPIASALLGYNADENGVLIYCSISGAPAGYAGAYQNTSSSAWMEFDARL